MIVKLPSINLGYIPSSGLQYVSDTFRLFSIFNLSINMPELTAGPSDIYILQIKFRGGYYSFYDFRINDWSHSEYGLIIDYYISPLEDLDDLGIPTGYYDHLQRETGKQYSLPVEITEEKVLTIRCLKTNYWEDVSYEKKLELQTSDLYLDKQKNLIKFYTTGNGLISVRPAEAYTFVNPAIEITGLNTHSFAVPHTIAPNETGMFKINFHGAQEIRIRRPHNVFYDFYFAIKESSMQDWEYELVDTTTGIPINYDSYIRTYNEDDYTYITEIGGRPLFDDDITDTWYVFFKNHEDNDRVISNTFYIEAQSRPGLWRSDFGVRDTYYFTQDLFRRYWVGCNDHLPGPQPDTPLLLYYSGTDETDISEIRKWYNPLLSIDYNRYANAMIDPTNPDHRFKAIDTEWILSYRDKDTGDIDTSPEWSCIKSGTHFMLSDMPFYSGELIPSDKWEYFVCCYMTFTDVEPQLPALPTKDPAEYNYASALDYVLSLIVMARRNFMNFSDSTCFLALSRAYSYLLGDNFMKHGSIKSEVVQWLRAGYLALCDSLGITADLPTNEELGVDKEIKLKYLKQFYDTYNAIRAELVRIYGY